MAVRGGRGGSSDAFGMGGNEGANNASRPDPFAVEQPGAANSEPREETDQEIVDRLSKTAGPPKKTLTNPLGDKVAFVEPKSQKPADPLTPVKVGDEYYDARNPLAPAKKLPKEKWKKAWDGLNGAQASAPAPGTLTKKTVDQVAANRAVKASAKKGGFTPSMPLPQVGQRIADAINKLHPFAGTIPTTFHETYGSQTSDHVKAAFAALDEAKGHLANAQANIRHSPGMAGNHTFDAAMAVHKALGHLTQPAIYRRHGRVPEGVTHDSTEGLVTAASEHSYGVNGAKPANLFSLAGKEFDLNNPKHLDALVKKIPTMTPEEKDIIVAKVRGSQPSTIKPHADDPEFAKKTADRAEEQETVKESNKVRKGNVGEVVDVRQASRMADGTMPAGGTSIGRGDSAVGVVNTDTAEREKARNDSESARREKITEDSSKDLEDTTGISRNEGESALEHIARVKETQKQLAALPKAKPEKGPRKKATPKPKAAAVPSRSLTIDQIFGQKKRGSK